MAASEIAAHKTQPVVVEPLGACQHPVHDVTTTGVCAGAGATATRGHSRQGSVRDATLSQQRRHGEKVCEPKKITINKIKCTLLCHKQSKTRHLCKNRYATVT